MKPEDNALLVLAGKRKIEMRKPRGQSIVEYGVLVTLTVAALVASYPYIKRAVQGRLKNYGAIVTPDPRYMYTNTQSQPDVMLNRVNEDGRPSILREEDLKFGNDNPKARVDYMYVPGSTTGNFYRNTYVTEDARVEGAKITTHNQTQRNFGRQERMTP
jgi:Flp pilus assembly pilin Flp